MAAGEPLGALATVADLQQLLPVGLGQSAIGSIPVWNGSAWSWIAPGSDGQVLSGRASASLGVDYETPPGSATPVTDGSVDRRDLHAAGWGPAAGIDENTDRFFQTETYTPPSGTLVLCGGAVLRRDIMVTGVAFLSIALTVTQTHLWFCLVDQSLNVIGKTADQGSTAWAAGSVLALPLTSTYTPGADIAVYLGLCCVAGTMPLLHANVSAAAVTGISPPLMATSNTGLTGPSGLGATAGALTAIAQTPGWGYVY